MSDKGGLCPDNSQASIFAEERTVTRCHSTRNQTNNKKNSLTLSKQFRRTTQWFLVLRMISSD